MCIPELELEVGPRALGGRFTTVEGLLTAVKEQLSDGTQSHVAGDSQDPEIKTRYDNFMKNLEQYLDGGTKFTLILDDPAGNSYVQVRFTRNLAKFFVLRILYKIYALFFHFFFRAC